MWLTEGLRVVAEALGLVAKRTELKNAPDVKEAAKRQHEVDATDAETRAVCERDEEAIRKNIKE